MSVGHRCAQCIDRGHSKQSFGDIVNTTIGILFHQEKPYALERGNYYVFERRVH